MTERSLAYVPLDEILPAEVNPKRHRIDVTRASTERFGYIEPVVVDERTGRLVAGHGRVETLAAACAEGAEPPEGVQVDEQGRWLVPAVRGWASQSDSEAIAAGIALNRGPEIGGWDDTELAGLLERIAATDLGLSGVGYADDDLEQLLIQVRAHERHVPTDVDPDEVPEPPADPITKLGDLWLLGDHRLLVGDSTDREVIDRVLTDLDGDQGIKEVEALWRASFSTLADVMPPGTPYYINGPQGGDLGLLLLLLLLRDSGLAPRHILIWVKNRPSFSIGRLDYDYQHEPIVYGWKPGAAHPWYAEETQTSVFHVDRPQASPDHPTTKPVELIRQLVVNSTRPGGMVLDPFLGGGTTLVACEMTGRRGRGIEVDPRYADVTLRRWERLTGEKPILEATGEPYSFVAEPEPAA